MKKLLQLKTMLLLCALIVGSGSVWAVDVTFTFNTDEGISALGISKPSSSAGTNLSTSTPYTIDGVNMAVTNGGTSTRVWNSGGTLDLRIYKNGGSLTFTAPGNITKIVLTGSVVNKFSTTVGSFSDGTWEGDEASVKLTATDTGKINTITVTYTSSGEATTVTIDDSGIKSDRKGGTAAGTFSASVTAGGEIVDGAMVSWSSSEESVATIDEDGKLTLVAAGKTTITATYAGNATYASSTGTYKLTVTDSRTVAGLEFETPSQTINVGQMHGAFTLSNPNSLTVSYSSDDTSVATVIASTGVVTGIAEGSTIIRATFEGNDDYKAGEASYTLTVNENAAVTPEGEDVGGGYVLVTDASTLAEGDKLIIVGISSGSYYAMSEQSTNNRKEKKVTMTDGVISINEDVQVITLEGEKDAWYFNVGNGYLYAASSGSNYLKTEGEKDANNNAKAKITISDGVASIVFQGTNTRKVLQYNSSSGLFACYSSASQSPVYLYRLNESNSFDVEIPDAGWRTLVSAKNVSLPSGVKAYTVTEASDDAVTLTEVASIKANNPYLLKGASGDCTLTVMDTDPVEPTGNLLQISDASTTNGVYVLANKSNGVGFYLWNGGYMGAGRVYLPSAVVTNAREFFGFDFTDITGISQARNEELQMGNVYNLNGQRVAQPMKGLYIVNGKKVIIK